MSPPRPAPRHRRHVTAKRTDETAFDASPLLLALIAITLATLAWLLLDPGPAVDGRVALGVTTGLGALVELARLTAAHRPAENDPARRLR